MLKSFLLCSLGWLWFSAAVRLKERGHFMNDSQPFLRNHIVVPEKSLVILCLYVRALIIVDTKAGGIVQFFWSKATLRCEAF